jgi:hypothetical protein
MEQRHMTMHPDPATPWQRPHRDPAAFTRMVEAPRAVRATLARRCAEMVLTVIAIGATFAAVVLVMSLAAVAIIATVAAWWPA